MESSPPSPFVVVQSYLVFEFEIVPLDAAAKSAKDIVVVPGCIRNEVHK
jgi:hypothetical protein